MPTKKHVMYGAAAEPAKPRPGAEAPPCLLCKFHCPGRPFVCLQLLRDASAPDLALYTYVAALSALDSLMWEVAEHALGGDPMAGVYKRGCQVHGHRTCMVHGDTHSQIPAITQFTFCTSLRSYSSTHSPTPFTRPPTAGLQVRHDLLKQKAWARMQTRGSSATLRNTSLREPAIGCGFAGKLTLRLATGSQ